MELAEFSQSCDRTKQEFCACIIEEDGNILSCEKGHLMALQELYKTQHPCEEELPKEAEAMFWLIATLKVVVVDYENQVYAKTLSPAQKQTLKSLKAEGLIEIHLCNIHDKVD